MVGPIDSPAVCCMKQSLDGFKLWEEKQSYTVQSGDNIRVQETFNLDSECVKRRSNSNFENYQLPVGETYNSYIAQTWKHNRGWFETENIIEFYKYRQDIVATIWLPVHKTVPTNTLSLVEEHPPTQISVVEIVDGKAFLVTNVMK